MNKAQQTHFDSLYQQHVNALTRQGKSKVTIESYARAVRRIATYFDRCPDQLSLDDLKDYFTSLVKTHSWSTVKIDRNGLQFFYKHVLGKQWTWVSCTTIRALTPEHCHHNTQVSPLTSPYLLIVPPPTTVGTRSSLYLPRQRDQ